MDIIIDIHSWLRWLVLLALIGGAGIGFVRNGRGEPWQEGFFSLAVIVIDVQVLLGIIIWVFNSGWDAGFFFAVLHPLLMLGALAIAHIGLVRARRRNDTRSNLIVAWAFTLSLVDASQTVAGLEPKGEDGFDFTPSDWLRRRSRNRTGSPD